MSGPEGGTDRTGRGEDRRESPGRWLMARAKPFSASLTALSVAVIGLIGQQALKHREERLTERTLIEQKRLSERTLIEQKSRLFVELMSRREESESDLRADMFRAILGEYFEKPQQGDEVRAMSKRLLKLEMLALNFGESLSLSPLFRELERDLVRFRPEPASYDPNDEPWPLVKDVLLERLRALARRVAAWQMTSLEQPGSFFTFDVGFEEAEAEYGVTVDCMLELDGLQRMVRVVLKTPRLDEDAQTVQAEVFLSRYERAGEAAVADRSCTRSEAPAAGAQPDFQFELSWFDFPMIDNTRLEEDHRFALTLTRLDEFDGISVSGAIFPGLYGSQRNKPFLDIVLEHLPGLLEQEEPGAQEEAA